MPAALPTKARRSLQGQSESKEVKEPGLIFTLLSDFCKVSCPPSIYLPPTKGGGPLKLPGGLCFCKYLPDLHDQQIFTKHLFCPSTMKCTVKYPVFKNLNIQWGKD